MSCVDLLSVLLFFSLIFGLHRTRRFSIAATFPSTLHTHHWTLSSCRHTMRSDHDCRSENDETSWDDICVSPHESQMQQGRVEGHQAGLQAGYRDGYALGRTKGVEIGMELGFMKGALMAIDEKLLSDDALVVDSDPVWLERIRKGVVDLKRAICQFPSPDDMFRSESRDGQEKTTSIMERDTGDSESQRRVDSVVDVQAKLQRLRAKFKVLTAQLKIPKFSLKHVLADATLSAETSRWQQGEASGQTQLPEDSEW